MTNTPGWSSPGSSPSDGQEPGRSGPADATGHPDPAPSADQPGGQQQSSGVKWAKEQPPPGQWSAPTGAPPPGQTPPPPGSGWGAPGGPGGYGSPGGYGAWGTGWGGPPPAAKPGVIPLRPLGLGEILDGAVTTMRTYWRTVLGISLVVAVLTEIVTILVQRSTTADTNQVLSDPNATPAEFGSAMLDSLLGSGVVLVVTMVGIVVATALLTMVTSRAVLGRPVTVGEAWQDARPQLLKLFGLVFLLLLICLGIVAVGALPGIVVAAAGSPRGGAVLAFLGVFAAFVPITWLAIRFSLASPALMLEKQGITKAMSRSGKLVRGSWWRIFGIQLLTALITSLVSAVVTLPFAVIGILSSGDGPTDFLAGTFEPGWTYLIITGIGAMIGLTITLPISACVTVLLYIDQRIRREALDLELARAAGVPSHGSDPTAPGS